MGCNQTRVHTPEFASYGYADYERQLEGYRSASPNEYRSIKTPTMYRPPNSAVLDPHRNVVIEEEMLEEYIRLERMIRTVEKTRVLQRLQTKIEELRTVTDEVHELEQRQKSITQKLENKNSNANVDKKKTSFREHEDEVDWAAQTYVVPKENKLERHLKEAAKNKALASEDVDLQYALNIVSKELVKRKKKFRTLDREVEELNVQAAHLLDLYLRLDEHLAELFASGSGTEQINRLERELSFLEDKQQRLEIANAKWQESQMLLEFACRQLAVAVQQWKNLPSIPTINVEIRYNIDNDKPSNAHRVNKTIQGVERRMDSSSFPFCSPEDLRRFNEVPVHVYAEMFEPLGLLSEKNKPYSDTYLRALILLQWFDQVLNSTMQRDLTEVSADVRKTAQALRRERLRLVRKKVHQLHGKDMDLDSGMDSDTEEDMKAGFESLFISRLPRGYSNLDDSFRFAPLMDDRYDIQGDLEKLEQTTRSGRARSAMGLSQTLKQRRMRRAVQNRQSALMDAVNTLQKT